jgi:hypothetical protein
LVLVKRKSYLNPKKAARLRGATAASFLALQKAVSSSEW